MKSAIVPLLKSGPKICLNDYRDISLLPMWSEKFGHATKKRHYNYFDCFKYFCSNYFDSEKNSTTDSLAKFSQNISNDSSEQAILLSWSQEEFDTFNPNFL